MEGSTCSCKSGCKSTMIAKILLIIGGLNWGLMAINPEWNVVNMLLGEWPQVERVIYGLVGLAAVMLLVKMCMKMCGGGCCGGMKK